VAELQSFALVLRHQPHAVRAVLVRAAGGQRRVVEQFARAMEAARELDRLQHVLETVLRRLRAALAQHGPVARHVQQKRDLVSERRVRVSADTPDCIHECEPCQSRLGRQVRRFECGQERDLAPGRFLFQFIHRLGAEATGGGVDYLPQRLVRLHIVGCDSQSQ